MKGPWGWNEHAVMEIFSCSVATSSQSLLGNNDGADAQRPANSNMNHRMHDGDDDVSIGWQGEGMKKER